MSDHNHRRAFSEVVSLEAWHDSFCEAVEAADLHVAVAFLTGRLGGRPEDEVRFQLSLKRAEVLVIVPPGEPARVDPRSVSRDGPMRTIETSQSLTTNSKTSAQGSANLSAKLTDLAAGLGLAINAEESTNRELALKIASQIKGMAVQHSTTGEGHHQWSVTPPPDLGRPRPSAGPSGVLSGAPWDGGADKRLTVVDTRANRDRGLAPSIRVEIRCRREDLHISDIELKDEKAWREIKRKPNQRNKIAAAEAIIRSRLFSEGLFRDDFDERYATMTLASITAQSA